MSNNDLEQFQGQLDAEVEKLKAASIGSIDPGLHAKTVALMNGDVKKLILNKFQSAEKLQKVDSITTYGGDVRNCEVILTFETPASTLVLIPRKALIIVDLPGKCVKSIVDPYVGGVGKSNVHVPLAFAVPIRSKEIVVSPADAAAHFQRQRAFAQKLGIARSAVGPLDTPTTHYTTSDTYYGTQGTDGDGNPVTVVDYEQDSTLDSTEDDA
jgi:hypothetical protein